MDVSDTMRRDRLTCLLAVDRIAFFQECLKEATEPLSISDADMAAFVNR